MIDNFNYFLKLHYLTIEFDKYWDLFYDNIEISDLIGFSNEAFKVTNIKAINSHIARGFEASFNPDIVEAELEAVNDIIDAELDRVIKDNNIDNNLVKILDGYHRFKYDLYHMDDLEDIYQHLEDIIDYLPNNEIKNYHPINDNQDEEILRSLLNEKYLEYLTKYAMQYLRDKKPTAIERGYLILQYWDNYEAQNMDLNYLFEIWFNAETYAELFEAMNGYSKYFVFCDEDGEPSKKDYTAEIIADLFEW